LAGAPLEPGFPAAWSQFWQVMTFSVAKRGKSPEAFGEVINRAMVDFELVLEAPLE
jgi:hypothetical protein